MVGYLGIAIFITHPDVTIDPEIPVPEWSLSPRGLRRMSSFCNHHFVRLVSSVFASSEKKAIDGAELLAQSLGIKVEVEVGLGENDRSSTGYLPREEFLNVARQFFASPERSVLGWETAAEAQQRIVNAVRAISHRTLGRNVAIVSHGGVGTLLMCHLRGAPISLAHKPPVPEGGCYFSFDLQSLEVVHDWLPVEEPARELDERIINPTK